MKRRISAVVLCVAVMVGCAREAESPYVKDGKEYGVTSGVFRGRWWSYYERGCSYQSGGFYQEAAADFENALEGRDLDSWQARTYGLHFVEYFPNRELGVTYYHLGDLEKAQEYLDRSLEQVDTARAHYYVDLVAKDKIARGDVADTSDPIIQTVVSQVPEDAILRSLPVQEAIVEAPAMTEAQEPSPVEAAPAVAAVPVPETAIETAPVPIPEAKVASAPPVLVKDREVPVEIAAADDTGVSEVTLNDKPMHQRGSAAKITFRDDVLLTEGEHELTVVAKDLANKEVVKKVKVNVDLSGPTIGIFLPTDPTVTERTSVRLEGASVDKNGITTVALDERILAESPGEKRVEFATDLPLSSGENSFMLLAKDVAGNQTRSPIKVFQGNPESAEARLWLLEQRHPELLVLASAGAPTSLPALLRSLELMAGAVDEEEGIRINLKSPAPDRPYRHNKTLRVSGTVISDGNVASLNINGEPYESLVGAPKEVFDKRIPLDDATLAAGMAQVDIAVNAGDTLGHANTLQFEVPVRPIFLESRESKMPVAVMPFTPHGEHLGGEDASLLRVETEGRIQEGKRFRVIDRTQLESVLTEQQLAALADPNEAIQLCKVVNAQAFIVADVFEYGSSGMEVKARAISAETTDVVATLDVFVADRNDRGAITQACDDLAQQLARTFPRLSGELVAVKDAGAGQEMLVNWTAEDGIKEGMYLIVVHEEVWGDEDDEFAERELVEVGKARIERVLKNSSKAVTVTTEGDVKLEEGMAAVTM